jgi:hypothetical protein
MVSLSNMVGRPAAPSFDPAQDDTPLMSFHLQSPPDLIAKDDKKLKYNCLFKFFIFVFGFTFFSIFLLKLITASLQEVQI